MILLGGFGGSARTRGWAVLDGLRSRVNILIIFLNYCTIIMIVL